MALGNLLKMYMDKATRATWAAKEAKGGPMTYDALWHDLMVIFGLNARGFRRGAWESLKLEFTGKGISRGIWEIYLAEFGLLAAESDIQEEEKLRKLQQAVPRAWLDCILDAEGRAHKVVLSGTRQGPQGTE